MPPRPKAWQSEVAQSAGEVFDRGFAAPASPLGRPRGAGFLMQPERTRANCFSVSARRRPEGDNLPERAQAGGNEESNETYCLAKATAPYDISEEGHEVAKGCNAAEKRSYKNHSPAEYQAVMSHPSVSASLSHLPWRGGSRATQCLPERKPPLEGEVLRRQPKRRGFRSRLCCVFSRDLHAALEKYISYCQILSCFRELPVLK
jgi:hypothetical protein